MYTVKRRPDAVCVGGAIRKYFVGSGDEFLFRLGWKVT